MSGTTTSLLTTRPRSSGAQGRVSVPATIIRTRSRGRKVARAPGVSKRGGGTAIYPRTHIPGYETSRR